MADYLPRFAPESATGSRGTNSIDEAALMQAEIHPKYEEMTATCSCGNVIKTKSTIAKDINVDVCAACHPFYTGKQKVMDTGGRIDRFKKRFGGRGTTK